MDKRIQIGQRYTVRIEGTLFDLLVKKIRKNDVVSEVYRYTDGKPEDKPYIRNYQLTATDFCDYCLNR